MKETAFSPIQDHAIIGDLHTVALVSLRGNIDFMCLPRLDGPSVFASLLDPHAGSFSVSFERDRWAYRQIYVPDTNVLVTRVLNEARVVEIIDFMVIGQDAEEPILVRRFVGLRGQVKARVRCHPAFGYAKVSHQVSADDSGLQFVPADGSHALTLISTAPLAIDGAAGESTFTISAGETVDFVFGARCPAFPSKRNDVAAYATERLAKTTAYWKAWSRKSTYKGRYQEVVMRSALALKLLVSVEHGSIAAAATFGLPEASKGERNWDYRFSWIRDASFAVYAFIRLGYIDEAVAFMHWLGRCLAVDCKTGPLQPLYAMDGSSHIEEHILEHFSGYEKAKPVRVGNAAAGQLQLDIYGACMDAVYLTSKYGGALSLTGWQHVCKIIDWVIGNWQQPDEGIWEARNGRHCLLHSRLMCWVAVDRAIRLVTKRSLPAMLPEWNLARMAIHKSIVEDFWNEELQSFVRVIGDTEVDASTLMMPLVRFIGAGDPKWRSTQAQIEKQLTEDGLVHRYKPDQSVDGMPGHEGAFTTCSFWLVECLARQGEVDRAHLMFEKILDYSNHVHLFAEEIGADGRQLGNFPQALTHLALISSAFALDRALAGDSGGSWN